jgi:hypothetical protein
MTGPGRALTRQMWNDARWIRLGGHPSESCCDTELAERLTQTTGETWRIELDGQGRPGAFLLICVCGSVAYLFEGISDERDRPFEHGAGEVAS